MLIFFFLHIYVTYIIDNCLLYLYFKRMLFFSLARRSRTTFGGNLPTSGPGKIWADQLCELQDWLETQDMNLQMQVVDVTDENAIVSVIEKVQVSKFKIFCTKHIATEIVISFKK